MELVRYIFGDFWHWLGAVILVVAFGCWFPMFGYTDARTIHKEED